MFTILVYDIKEERVGKIYKIVKRYLYWRQKSVFDGEINIADLNKLKEEIKKKIVEEEDFVLIYEFKNKSCEITNFGRQLSDDEII